MLSNKNVSAVLSILDEYEIDEVLEKEIQLVIKSISSQPNVELTDPIFEEGEASTVQSISAKLNAYRDEQARSRFLEAYDSLYNFRILSSKHRQRILKSLMDISPILSTPLWQNTTQSDVENLQQNNEQKSKGDIKPKEQPFEINNQELPDPLIKKQNPKEHLNSEFLRESDLISIIPENWLLREVLKALYGFDSECIKLKYVKNNPCFVLEESLKCNLSIQLLVSKISEFGILYAKVTEFTEAQKNNNPVTNHAVDRALRHHMTQVLNFIRNTLTSFEFEVKHLKNGSTLKQAAARFFPLTRKLRTLFLIVKCCEGLDAQNQLSMLHFLSGRGSEPDRKLIGDLLKAAAMPFWTSVIQWVSKGVLKDPYVLSFIQMQQEIDECDSFQKLFFIKNKIPSILSVNDAKIVFDCGDAVRLLGHVDLLKNDRDKNLFYRWPILKNNESFDFTSILNSVKIFSRIPHRLLLFTFLDQLLFKEHLRTIKEIVLLTNGDFSEDFFDSAKDHWTYNQETLHKQDLQGILDSALRQSKLRHLNSQCLSRIVVISEPINPLDSVWDCLQLDYECEDSIISRIFDEESRASYRKISSVIWKTRRAIKQLKVTSKLPASWLQDEEIYRLANEVYISRLSMLHVVTSILSYYILEVIEGEFKEARFNEIGFNELLETIHSLSALRSLHSVTLTKILDGLFLLPTEADPNLMLCDLINTILTSISEFVAAYSAIFITPTKDKRMHEASYMKLTSARKKFNDSVLKFVESLRDVQQKSNDEVVARSARSSSIARLDSINTTNTATFGTPIE
eukprot:GHVP01065593.1.p1 GENE.GHVP01065593.1~~GHVP01065593.1.p1  ORF type:complete len:797 (+),score=140.66 GHVP01065593.1:7198-9588(+)